MAPSNCWRSYLTAVATLLAVSFAPQLATGDVLNWYCGSPSNVYAPNSKFQLNIEHLAATLPRNASFSRVLFATAVIGVVPDTVYAILHCRGDLSPTSCFECGTGAFEDAMELCPYNKDSTVFYPHCTLRYSNQNIIISSATTEFGELDRALRWRSRQNASAPAAVFDTAVSVLVNKTAEYVPTSSTRFATGLNHDPIIFVLVQCTPDLAPSDCRKCLAYVLSANGLSDCSGAKTCSISLLRCGYFYDQFAFFSGAPLVQLPSAATGGSGRKGDKKERLVLKIALPISGAAAVAIGVLIYCFFCKERRR